MHRDERWERLFSKGLITQMALGFDRQSDKLVINEDLLAPMLTARLASRQFDFHCD